MLGVPTSHLSKTPAQWRRLFCRRRKHRCHLIDDVGVGGITGNVGCGEHGDVADRAKPGLAASSATIPAMPFSPSDLPWWGWLVCSVVALAVTYASWIIFDRCHDDPNSATGAFGYVALIFVAIPAGLIGMLVGLMGIVLFVKWVWTS